MGGGGGGAEICIPQKLIGHLCHKISNLQLSGRTNPTSPRQIPHQTGIYLRTTSRAHDSTIHLTKFSWYIVVTSELPLQKLWAKLFGVRAPVLLPSVTAPPTPPLAVYQLPPRQETLLQTANCSGFDQTLIVSLPFYRKKPLRPQLREFSTDFQPKDGNQTLHLYTLEVAVFHCVSGSLDNVTSHRLITELEWLVPIAVITHREVTSTWDPSLHENKTTSRTVGPWFRRALNRSVFAGLMNFYVTVFAVKGSVWWQFT